MQADPIDDKLSELKSLLSSPGGSSDATFWAKFVTASIAALYFLYLKYQLAAKEKALAEARTEIALTKFQGQQDLAKQQVDASEAAVTAAQKAANDHEALIADEEKKYVDQVKQYMALKSWNDLNSAAGVK